MWGRIGSGVLVVVVALAGAATLGAAPAQAAESDSIAGLVNQARWANGQAGLLRNGALDTVAVNWANQMAQANSLTHNPNTGSQIPAGWSRWGENIAQGYPNASAVHAGWMASPGHHANIVGDFTDLGVAFISAGGTTWAVEVFAKYAGHAGPAAPAAAAVAPAPAAVQAAPPAPAPAKPVPAPAAPVTAPVNPVPPPDAAATPERSAASAPSAAPTPTRTRAASRAPTAALAAKPTAFDSTVPHPLWIAGLVAALFLVGGLATWLLVHRRRTHA
jgi:hypothetical protein